MKRYKSNYLFTVAFQICNGLLATMPGVIIMGLILGERGVLLHAIPTYAVVIFVFAILANIIHLIICLFTKHTVFIDNDTISVKERKKLSQSMKLDDVKYVVFDQGAFSKSGSTTPASITLYNEGCKSNVQINDPSFFMICYLQRSLKNASYEFRNYKWYISMACIFAAFLIFLSLAG